MKLRVIIIVLALLSFLSTSIGGYLYYSSLKNAALEEAFYRSDELLEDLSARIDFYLGEHLKSVRTLAGLKDIQDALESNGPWAMAKANSILNHFQKTLEVNVCYLMDKNGNTIVSSNLGAPDSFVGKNYAFSPYFNQAIKGIPSVYMALGVTSKKRGAYFGYPVFRNKSDVPLGVVVIKAFIDDIENEMNKPYEGIIVLADPHGVVFTSNNAEWIYKVLWKVSNEELNEILESRQFGAGPRNWTGIERKDEQHAVDKSGKEYHIHSIGINNYPGWNILYLHDHDKVMENIRSSFFKTAGYIILSLCVLIGISVFLLYKKASYDIIMRKRAEEELKKHLAMEKQFSRELEPLVAERTMSLIALTVADKLRNPASVIGLICRRLFKKLNDAKTIKEGLNDIVNETHKLDKIVYDYKTLLDSKKSVFEYYDINNIVREAIILIQLEAKEKGIKLITNLSDNPLKINLQKNLLRIAIYHLLFNAVEATPGGGTITILTLTNDDNVILEISDTGIGFKKHEKEKVFDPFFSTKKHSYGMGLPLVMHIVIEHLGDIDVESEEGMGTTFRLTFPVRWIR